MSTTIELNKRTMDADAIAYHASLIRKQVKKKRTCLANGCGKKFISKSSAMRFCDSCARKSSQFGQNAYISM